MDYAQGINHMMRLHQALEPGQKDTFQVGNLLVSYPGYKKAGDYRLSENGVAPKHTDIVNHIYYATTTQNFSQVAAFLEDVYTNGLNAAATLFPQSFVEKIFWITLQEEINYPQPRYAGRKLPFQRYYEGVLAKLGHCTVQAVCERTNNRSRSRPVLYTIEDIKHPIFYK